MRRLFLALAAGSLAACSLLTSLDGLSGGGGGGATGDGGVGTTPDATSGGPDARADVAPGPDAAPGPSLCARQTAKPFFCADFEDSRPLGAVLSSLTVNGGASFDIDRTAGAGSSSSLAIVLPEGDGQKAASGQVALPDTLTKLTLEFDVRVDAFGAEDAHDLLGFYRNGDREVSLEITEGRILRLDEDIPVVDGGPDEVRTSLAFSFTNAWAHVRWAVEIKGDEATSVISVDGQPRGTVTTSALPFLDAVFVVGDRSVGALSRAWRSRLDNIVLHVE